MVFELSPANTYIKLYSPSSLKLEAFQALYNVTSIQNYWLALHANSSLNPALGFKRPQAAANPRMVSQNHTGNTLSAWLTLYWPTEVCPRAFGSLPFNILFRYVPICPSWLMATLPPHSNKSNKVSPNSRKSYTPSSVMDTFATLDISIVSASNSNPKHSRASLLDAVNWPMDSFLEPSYKYDLSLC
jgi:hypothetical protein